MTIALERYLSDFDEDERERAQPEAVTAAFRRLIVALRKTEDSVAWERAIEGNMAEARNWITTGLVDGLNAAGALFVGHALLAGCRAVGHVGGTRIVGFVIQLSMSEAQWAEALEIMAAEGVARHDKDGRVLRIDRFPEIVLGYLVKRGEHDILREIFRGVRYAIDGVARRAMRDARDFDSWLADLALLATYLTMRRWLPLSENPILGNLFERSEIEMLQRKEAFAAECFAHLFASVTLDHITPEHQENMAAEYHRRETESRLDARQWLALGKSRFQIAPYV